MVLGIKIWILGMLVANEDGVASNLLRIYLGKTYGVLTAVWIDVYNYLRK